MLCCLHPDHCSLLFHDATGTGVPQQPAAGQEPPYNGEDNFFTKILPRANASATPAVLHYSYALPSDHLPGIHW